MSLIDNPRFRWFYTFVKGWEKRKELKRFVNEPQFQINSLDEITFERLEEANVAVLILDFDGVLASHGEKEPNDEAKRWLTDLCSKMGEQRIALLTNKPIPERLHYFKKNFPLIHVVQDVRKKPYPDGIKEIADYKGVHPDRVLLVDDRILTGMLATCLCYSQGWYFRRPYRNVLKRPIKELFFSFLRTIERWIFHFA